MTNIENDDPAQSRARKPHVSILILSLNVVLLLSVFLMYGRYTAIFQEQLRTENLGNIANLNQSAAINATALIGSWDIKLQDIARYAGRRSLTRDQLLEYLDDANSSDDRLFELIGGDYTGYLAQRDASGAFIPLTYAASSYAELKEILDDIDESSSTDICFAPEFTEYHTALKHFAVCTHLTLRDEAGAQTPYALLLAGKSRDVLATINNQNVFDGLSTVLVDGSGNYIVSNSDFKSDNFFQYLYVYNDLSLDQRSALAQEMIERDSGELFYQNALGQDCVFRYTRMTTNGWYCITSVPLTSFRVPVFSIDYALYAVVALLLLLGMDVIWLRNLNKRLQISILREKEAGNAKTDFLSRMSHDIRTPLNGIIGMTLLALDEPNPPRSREYLNNIKSSGDFLLGLVNDILDLSKVESGKMELHPEPYTDTEFRRYIEAVIAPLCRDREQVLRISPGDDTLCVLFDRLRLNQIFFNLLSNAVKYTPAGGLIELYWKTTRLPDSRVAFDFTVRDNGIGMSEEFQTRMFESFSQEHAQNGMPGSGLGLSIVWNLVRLMHGEIRAESKQGEGTAFFVHLEADICEERAQAKPVACYTRLENKRVLLCEDNQINTLIAQRLLNKWGMIVETAENGLIGLTMFRDSAPGQYDAILMDIRMPEMNGLDATRAIRALDRPDAARVPIIAMTANAYDTDVQNSLAAGMNAHLGKPIQPDLLRSTLMEFL